MSGLEILLAEIEAVSRNKIKSLTKYKHVSKDARVIFNIAETNLVLVKALRRALIHSTPDSPMIKAVTEIIVTKDIA